MASTMATKAVNIAPQVEIGRAGRDLFMGCSSRAVSVSPSTGLRHLHNRPAPLLSQRRRRQPPQPPTTRILAAANAAPRVARLRATKKLSMPMPILKDDTGTPKPLSAFLQSPTGRQTMLNMQALQKMEPLDDNIFRCHLRSVEILNFSVEPVIDLRVSTTETECLVEMLGCRFYGSEAVEEQNKHFTANFANRLKWEPESGSQLRLDNDIQLELNLEVFTMPFTMLPLSAVEAPGSAFLQALLDRLVPFFNDGLMRDYALWARGELSGQEERRLDTGVSRS